MSYRNRQARRDYHNVPPSAGEHYWHDEGVKGYWSIIKPHGVSIINIAQNPSMEVAFSNLSIAGGDLLDYTNPWGGLSGPTILRSHDGVLHGNFGAQIFVTVAGQGIGYNMTSIWAASVPYSASISIDGPPGARATLQFEHDADANAGRPVTVTLPGYPVRISARLTPTSVAPTASLVIAVRFDRAGEYRVDGLVLTQTSTPVTLYFDGDSQGATWNGFPHYAASTMSEQGRTFGERINLNEIGFNITGGTGWGLSPRQLITTAFARQNGAHLQRVKENPRTITLTGTFEGSPEEMHATRHELINALSWRFDGQCTQDLLLLYALYNECGCRISPELSIPVVYQAGLEGAWNTLDRERATLVFVANHDQGFSELFDAGEGDLTVNGQNEVVNLGNADVWAEIHMKPGAGGLEVEAIHNLTTGHSVFFGTNAVGGHATDLPLAYGEYAILRTNPAKRISLDLYSISGSTRIMHYIRYPDSQPGLLRLIPGLNLIQNDTAAISSGSRIFIKYQRRYQSVDGLGGGGGGCLEISE